MLYGKIMCVTTQTSASQYFFFLKRTFMVDGAFLVFSMNIQCKLKFLKRKVKLTTFFLHKQNQYKELKAKRIILHGQHKH